MPPDLPLRMEEALMSLMKSYLQMIVFCIPVLFVLALFIIFWMCFSEHKYSI